MTFVPSSCITQISSRLVNASRRPVGENAGSSGVPGAESRFTCLPPGARSSTAPDEPVWPS